MLGESDSMHGVVKYVQMQSGTRTGKARYYMRNLEPTLLTTPQPFGMHLLLFDFTPNFTHRLYHYA